MKLHQPPRRKPLRWTRGLRKLPVLSIRQPYAWLVANGIKDIENRSWRTHFRGPLLIHAGLDRSMLTQEFVEECEAIGRVRMPEEYDLGGVVGYVEVVDCVRRHGSAWKDPGSWGWVLANARPLRYRECGGALGFFHPKGWPRDDESTAKRKKREEDYARRGGNRRNGRYRTGGPDDDAQPRVRIRTPGQLRRAISKLSPASPFTDRFSARWRKLGRRRRGQAERKDVWYDTQHEHWLGWLKAYDGPGAYNRSNWHRSAEYVYNHIVNPQMLIYLAEAAGVDRVLLTKAARAALANHISMSAMSSAIRRFIPWSIVASCLTPR